MTSYIPLLKCSLMEHSGGIGSLTEIDGLTGIVAITLINFFSESRRRRIQKQHCISKFISSTEDLHINMFKCTALVD